MGSKYSDSHVENLDRFDNIIKRCKSFGAIYNPSNPILSIANMTNQLAEAVQLNSDYDEAYIETKMPINDRQDLVQELVRRVRRVNNAAWCSIASRGFKRDVKALADKFTGDKVRKKKKIKGKTVKKRRSNSHLGVDSRRETFAVLLELLRNEPGYAPNEPILQLAALDAAAAKFDNLNKAVNVANINATFKMIERDKGLYLENDGLVDVSLLCKKYVRALFGARSEEAKSLGGFKLKRFKRIKKS